MSVRIYMAAPYSRRAELQYLALRLPKTLTVTARWLDGEHEASDHNATIKQMQGWAAGDLHAITESDVLVLFTDVASYRGGCHVETGYALALGKQIVVVGPVANIFHALPGVQRFDTWSDARTWLIAWASVQEQEAA